MATLSVDIKANATQAQAQFEKLGTSVEQVGEDLLRMVDSGKRAGKSQEDIARDIAKSYDVSMDKATAAVKKLNDVLEDAGKAGKDAGDDIERGLDDVGDSAKKAGDKAGTNLRDGLKKGTSEAKEEIGQSGREAAASFSGGFDDVADFVQESLANALSGFGPAGAAAGIALAAVVGSVLNDAVMTQERLAEARERAADLASTLYDQKGPLPLADRVDELFDLLATEAGPQNGILTMIDQWVDFGSTLDAVKRSARQTGIGVDALMDAFTTGDTRQAEALLEGLNEKIQELEANASTAWAFDENLRSLRDTRDEIQKNVDAQKMAAEFADTALAKAAAAEDANREKLKERGAVATQVLADMQADTERLAGLWQNAATDAASYFTKTEEGATAFDWNSYLTDAEATMSAADEIKKRLVGLPDDIRAEAERIFSAQGAVAANEYTRAYEAASDADKGRFVAAASANGEAMGTAQADELKKAFGTPALPTTLDDTETRIRLQQLRDKAAEALRVRLLPDTSAVDNYMSALQRRAAEGVTVRVNAGQGRVWE